MQRIAMIGIGCRFPGRVAGPASCWSLLEQGCCAIGEIPADRWSLPGFHARVARFAELASLVADVVDTARPAP